MEAIVERLSRLESLVATVAEGQAELAQAVRGLAAAEALRAQRGAVRSFPAVGHAQVCVPEAALGDLQARLRGCEARAPAALARHALGAVRGRSHGDGNFHLCQLVHSPPNTSSKLFLSPPHTAMASQGLGLPAGDFSFQSPALGESLTLPDRCRQENGSRSASSPLGQVLQTTQNQPR